MPKRSDDAASSPPDISIEAARRRLEEELERCLRQAERTRRSDDGASPDASVIGADIVDHIQARGIERNQVAVASRVAARVAAIRAALERLADGRYGVCVRCSRDIGRARLRAMPEVATCIACQQEVERAMTRRIA
jgi:DnaK suppressor protein